MTEPEIYSAIQDIFPSLFPKRTITVTPELSARDVVGWDSMKQVELIMAVEERFDIMFKPKDIENLNSIGDLVAAISRYVNA